jgi:hypothetical protein
LLSHASTLAEAEEDAEEHKEFGDLVALLETIPKLDKAQQKVVIALASLSAMLDGHINKKEGQLIQAFIDVADNEVASDVGNILNRLKLLTQRFRNDLTLEAEDLLDCIQGDAAEEFSLPAIYHYNECAGKCTKLVTC